MLQSQKEHGKLNWEYTVRFTFMTGTGSQKQDWTVVMQWFCIRLSTRRASYAICDTYCLSVELFTVKKRTFVCAWVRS